MSLNISVIIPSFRPKAYLWDCLTSLERQTYNWQEFEVILVLNGCKEPYQSNVIKWLKQHKELNLRLIQTNIGGVSNARNIAIEEAKGEYITFIDDDDYVSPSYLEELYQGADYDTISLCYPLSFIDGTSNFEKYHITYDYIKNKGKGKVRFTSARKFFSGPVYKLIHKDIIGKHRFDTRLKNGEDSLFMFAISDKITQVAFTSESAIYYRRIRENSADTRKKCRKEKIKSNAIQIIEYSKLLLCGLNRYNFGFFITRVGGAFVGMIKK